MFIGEVRDVIDHTAMGDPKGGAGHMLPEPSPLPRGRLTISVGGSEHRPVRRMAPCLRGKSDGTLGLCVCKPGHMLNMHPGRPQDSPSAKRGKCMTKL